MLRSHSPSNLPERGGALSFAQQVKLVTPEFQALISSCTKVRALLDAIVPCPHPRAEWQKKRYACNRAGCWLRTSNLTALIKKLLADSRVTFPSHMGGPSQIARRCWLMQAENRAAAASLLGLGL
jgi:hypothetical protein